MEAETRPTRKVRSRKNQTAACDRCRKLKVKCDGKIPCTSCLSRGEGGECITTPQKKRGRTPHSQTLVPAGIQDNQGMNSIAIRTLYFDVYFKYLNPIFGLVTDRASLERQALSKAKQLQLNAILATTARSCGNRAVTTKLTAKAKDLAKSLIDDFSQSAAVGFGLLATYYWPEDVNLAAHYASMGWTLSKRVSRGRRLRIENFCFLLMCFTDFQEEFQPIVGRKLKGWKEDRSEYNAGPQSFHDIFQALVFEVKSKLLRRSRDLIDQDIVCSTTTGQPLGGEEDSEGIRELVDQFFITKEVGEELLQKMNDAENVLLAKKESFGPTWAMSESAVLGMKVVILAAMGMKREAHEVARESVQLACERRDLLHFAPPYTVRMLFTTGVFAFQLKDLDLLKRVAEVVKPLSNLYSVSAACYQKLEAMVRTCANDRVVKVQHKNLEGLLETLDPTKRDAYEPVPVNSMRSPTRVEVDDGNININSNGYSYSNNGTPQRSMPLGGLLGAAIETAAETVPAPDGGLQPEFLTTSTHTHSSIESAKPFLQFASLDSVRKGTRDRGSSGSDMPGGTSGDSATNSPIASQNHEGMEWNIDEAVSDDFQTFGYNPNAPPDLPPFGHQEGVNSEPGNILVDMITHFPSHSQPSTEDSTAAIDFHFNEEDSSFSKAQAQRSPPPVQHQGLYFQTPTHGVPVLAAQAIASGDIAFWTPPQQQPEPEHVSNSLRPPEA